MYAFLSAADDRGPRWEIYARRLGAPLGLGLLIGLLIALVVEALPRPWGSVLIIVLALAGLVWALWQLQDLRRITREAEETLRKIAERN